MGPVILRVITEVLKQFINKSKCCGRIKQEQLKLRAKQITYCFYLFRFKSVYKTLIFNSFGVTSNIQHLYISKPTPCVFIVCSAP